MRDHFLVVAAAEKNSSYTEINVKDRDSNDANDENQDTNSKSPNASSPTDTLSVKPASNSPPAVHSTDEHVAARPTSPISPSSSPHPPSSSSSAAAAAAAAAAGTKEAILNQHQLFSLPSNEHEMSEAVKRVLASVYSEATRSAFSPIMATTYLNHHHHQQNRFFAAPYPSPHSLYFHHPPPPPPPPPSSSTSGMPSSASMNYLSRPSALGPGPRHPSHHRCILPFCTCKLVAPPPSSSSPSSTN